MEKFLNGKKVYVLPQYSYYYWGYDNFYENRRAGYTYTRPPIEDDTTGYADKHVTHVVLDEDVVILQEDEDGVYVEWDDEKPAPFIRIDERSEEK